LKHQQAISISAKKSKYQQVYCKTVGRKAEIFEHASVTVTLFNVPTYIFM